MITWPGRQLAGCSSAPNAKRVAVSQAGPCAPDKQLTCPVPLRWYGPRAPILLLRPFSRACRPGWEPACCHLVPGRLSRPVVTAAPVVPVPGLHSARGLSSSCGGTCPQVRRWSRGHLPLHTVLDGLLWPLQAPRGRLPSCGARSTAGPCLAPRHPGKPSSEGWGGQHPGLGRQVRGGVQPSPVQPQQETAGAASQPGALSSAGRV